MRSLMNGTRGVFAAGLVALALAGCGGHNTGAEGIFPDLPTVLKVENDSFNDVRVYVYQGGQRIRLGIANGKNTTSFTIPKRVVPGMVTLRFQGVPIGGPASEVTEEITISPGEEVILRIPPT